MFVEIQHHVQLIIHEVLKLDPEVSFYKHRDASARIACMFLELLDRQFPIDSLEETFSLRTAQDYSARLSVHVNHLNFAVKLITGKTTTEHIAARIFLEAQALLKYTSWTISQIALCLGFEHASNFSSFFRKRSGITPGMFRAAS